MGMGNSEELSYKVDFYDEETICPADTTMEQDETAQRNKKIIPTGETYDPLKRLMFSTELIMEKRNIKIDLSSPLLLDSQQLYRGLQENTEEQILIKTDNYAIVGDNRGQISIKNRTSVNNIRERKLIVDCAQGIKQILTPWHE